MRIFICLLFTFSFIGCTQQRGRTLFNQQCAVCHQDNGQNRAPDLTILGSMTPKSIFSALESGKMQLQGVLLSAEEKIALAEFITKRNYDTASSPIPNYCNPQLSKLDEVHYFGWGGDLQGSGFVPAHIAQITKADAAGLRLKWAFGFEGGSITRSKPTVIGESIIFGSQFGEVYCLNIHNGCVQWRFEADATIRGGIAVSQDLAEETRIYFADFNGNTYALTAQKGELLWKTSVKNEPMNAVTGTAVYYDSLVYVPLTSMEVVRAGDDNYECCQGSGQVVALNAVNGQEVWRHRVISEKASPRGKNRIGSRTFGPSGAPVWCSPTVDSSRNLLYIGTGENNSNPPTLNSDALQALDLKSGALVWNFQATPKDAYISACPDAANCPDPMGPDVDFGMAPILTQRADGKEVLLAGQKSGVVYCLEPTSGKLIWKRRIGRGGALGGIHWGMATDGEKVYATNSDWLAFGGDSSFMANPGIFALNLMDGKVEWQNTTDPALCEGKRGCYNSNSAAPTITKDLVFAGGLDGYARAYDAKEGKVLWQYNTNQSFTTVNGIHAHGGAIDGPGPVIAHGIVIFNSGYALFGQMPGNVLLAFSAE